LATKYSANGEIAERSLDANNTQSMMDTINGKYPSGVASARKNIWWAAQSAVDSQLERFQHAFL
jgi:hypothetical protein